MVDGFGINSGVKPNAGRENPEGVSALPSAALPVPTNVPFVQPANSSTNPAPSQSALSLAQTLGGIDFGALVRNATGQSAAKRKLREEQDQAAGQTEAAMILSQTGADYDTLIRSGRIPASASPAFKLGAGIAAAQAELGHLRKAVLQRAQDNPNAPVFTEDAEFMNQFYGRLGGVRNEAVVKYFLEPVQALAEDDTKRYIAGRDNEAKAKLTGDVVGAFEQAIGAGDAIPGALNNAINVLKISNHKNPTTMAALIKSAGPQIVEASRDENGRVNLAKAGRMLMEIGQTKVTSDGDRKLSLMYTDDYDALSSYVYGSVNRAAQADTAQDEARQDEAQESYLKYLRENFSGIDAGTAMEKGVELGLDAKTAVELYKSWDSAAGNKSQAEISETREKASWRSTYDTMTPAERKAERAYLNRAYREGVFTGREDEYSNRMDLLDKSDHTDEQKAPISGNDRGKITATLYNQMSLMFGSPNRMQSALMGATTAYGLSTAQSESVRKKVADRLTDVAMSWMMQQPGFSNYTMATENVTTDQGGPARAITELTQQFIQTNQTQLSTLIPRALASANPDAALSSMQLNHSTRVYSAPSKTKHTSAHAPAKSAAPSKPVVRSVAHETKQVTRAMGNIMDTRSPIYQWYAMDVKSRNPKLTDAEVMKRVKALPPNAVHQLQMLYDRQHNPTGGR